MRRVSNVYIRSALLFPQTTFWLVRSCMTYMYRLSASGLAVSVYVCACCNSDGAAHHRDGFCPPSQTTVWLVRGRRHEQGGQTDRHTEQTSAPFAPNRRDNRLGCRDQRRDNSASPPLPSPPRPPKLIRYRPCTRCMLSIRVLRFDRLISPSMDLVTSLLSMYSCILCFTPPEREKRF